MTHSHELKVVISRF